MDRKSKDRQKLFKGTFEALEKGKAVALFPEGTSYTEPRIMQVKDGAAWAALEYLKYKQAHPELADQPDVKIVPAAIVYTNKSKYRSAVSCFVASLSSFMGANASVYRSSWSKRGAWSSDVKSTDAHVI